MLIPVLSCNVLLYYSFYVLVRYVFSLDLSDVAWLYLACIEIRFNVKSTMLYPMAISLVC